MSNVPSWVPTNGIALVAEVFEPGIVHPHVHRELELADQACASDEGGYPSLRTVFRCVFS